MAMRDEIKEEVEKQLRERGSRRMRRNWILFCVMATLFGGAAIAQQQSGGLGGTHQMADLFKVFFTWTASQLTVASNRTFRVVGSSTTLTFDGNQPNFFYLTGSAIRITDSTSGSALVIDTGAINSLQVSGSNSFQQVDGARVDLGSAANDYLDSNGSYARVGGGAGYLASATPFTLDSVYVNAVPTAVTYGGGGLPARAFTVVSIRHRVRTAGSGGSTNAVFQISDGTNTCTCSYACNATQGSKIITCANGAGTGCAYAASASLTYSYTSVGDCGATSADIQGNINVQGYWQ